MATRKKAEPEKKQQQTEPTGEEVLQKAAKAIGSALGKVAVKTGIAHPEGKPKKTGKLVKKAKQRLPRKEKKLAKKKLLASAG